MPLSSIPEALEAFRRGEFLVVLDDDDRENEGDLIIAAEACTPEKIAFIVRYCSGVICVALTGERVDQLRLPPMVTENTEKHTTAFTVSVDLKAGTTTGISAADRCATIKALVDPSTKPADLARPGHIFPLRAREGGVLKRAGHTEATVDLCRLSGFRPGGVLCEIVNDDGTMSRFPQLEAFAKTHNLHMITIADLIQYRLKNECFIKLLKQSPFKNEHGNFHAFSFESLTDHTVHMALVSSPRLNPDNIVEVLPSSQTGLVDEEGRSIRLGPFFAAEEPVLVRVHAECVAGDALGCESCDCKALLHKSLAAIAANGGVLVYLRGAEGKGVGLCHPSRQYTLDDKQHSGHTDRNVGVGSQILCQLGLSKVRVLTNNPISYGGLSGHGIEVVEKVPL
eukprot:GILI01005754.1.p1 GENE.GILI01005754.1~~GILI01005754.1.p1  ORF type:complete len:396 (+),score=129.91 GILI01005754.1:87-1274(+)